MTKLKKIDYFVISLFTIIEIALYLSFLFIDKNIIKSDLDSSILKYLGIICALLFSFYSLFKKKKAINLFIPLALIFTLISDYFLLFNKEKDFELSNNDNNFYHHCIFPFSLPAVGKEGKPVLFHPKHQKT